jgi:hypothetical protein
MPLRDLKTIPEWYEFRKRYQHDITAFAIEVLGMKKIGNNTKNLVSWQQDWLFSSIQIPGSRTTVSSGHGTGKSRSAGITAFWHTLCFPDAVTLFTAPNIKQLRQVVWKEIAICYDRLKNSTWAWLADYIVILAEKVYVKGYEKTWHVIAQTAPKHQPTNIAGQHGDNYLLWIDEAAGVDDAVMEVVLNALTHDDNRCIMTSQPARNAGFFYDSHHKLSRKAGGVWNALVLNGELSPLVKPKVLQEALERYGSREDPAYMVRIRGLFPDLAGEFLISNGQFEASYMGNALEYGKHDDYGYVISCDVGGGRGRDDSVILIAKVWGEAHFRERARRVEIIEIPLCKNTDNIHELAGIIDNALARYPNASVVLDANGAGIGLSQHLISIGISYTAINWGGQCFSRANQKIYANKRSQAITCMSRAVSEGRLKLKDKRYKIKLGEQITRLPYSFDDKTRYWVMPKEQMKAKKGLKSPDIADALAFLFLDGIGYTAANDAVFNSNSANSSTSSLFDELERLEQEALGNAA